MTHEAGQPDEEGQGGFLAGNHKDIIQVQSKGEASHLCEDVRTVSHDAGQPDKGGCGGILAGKQEIHNRVCHGRVCRVLRVRQPSRISFSHFLQAALCPEVHQAAGIVATLHKMSPSMSLFSPLCYDPENTRGGAPVTPLRCGQDPVSRRFRGLSRDACCKAW